MRDWPATAALLSAGAVASAAAAYLLLSVRCALAANWVMAVVDMVTCLQACGQPRTRLHAWLPSWWRSSRCRQQQQQQQQQIADGLLATIGHTPLIRINSLSDATGCEVSSVCHPHKH